MDVRIGITQVARELLVELADDVDRDALKGAVNAALSGATDTLSLTDRRGREVLVPAAKIAYVEVGVADGERRMGFGELTAAVGAAPTDLIDHRLLFVTGKGGVGKTTISAALAIHAANHGRRVLVCEVDAKGTLAAAFEAGPLRFEARPVHDGISAMAMNTEDSLREYLRLYVRLPLVARLGPLARTFDFVADAAPGVKEILTVGKVCYEVRERHYDLVVVDAAASGHIAAQLSAPWSINDLVQVGLVRDQTRWMTEILADPHQTGVVVVTTPEELPVNETLELIDRLGATVPVRMAAVVVNRVLPELFTHDEEAVFAGLRTPAALQALSRKLARSLSKVSVGAAARDVTSVLDAAALAVALRRERAENLAVLQERLPAGLATVLVPELFARSHGKRAVMQVAAALQDELG